MLQKKKQKLIVILGPTATGKSDLAVLLAKKLNGEIISADSRQVYQGLDIGTGKVPRDKKQESRIPPLPRPRRTRRNQEYFYKKIPHYLLDVTDPKKQFSVAEYQKLGEKALADIIKRGKLPIICGGTGPYIDALIYNSSFPKVPPNAALRKKLEKLSSEVLFEKLGKLDPRRAKNIDKHNRRRLVRALEIVLTTGKKVPEAQEKKSEYDALKIGIAFPNEVLHARIEKRLLARMKKGMAQEVKRLHTKGLSWKRMEELGLEYRYLSRYLRGMMTKEEMIEKLTAEIWHYAKRQMTWFKRDKKIHWVTRPKEALRHAHLFLQ